MVKHWVIIVLAVLPITMLAQGIVVRDTALTYVQMALDETTIIHPQHSYGALDNFVPSAITLLQQPQYGQTHVTTDGISYTPNRGYTGPDNMLCKMQNAQGQSQVVSILLDITNDLTFSGSEFYFTYLKNDYDPFGDNSLPGVWYDRYRILSLVDTRAYITDDEGNLTTVDIPAHTYYEGSIRCTVSHPHNKHAFYLTSSAPVVVEAINYDDASHDVTVVLPSRLLGTSYIAQMPHWSKLVSGQFIVAATEDNTTVEINLTLPTEDHAAGVPYTIQLNRGETYELTKVIPYSSSYHSASYHAPKASSIQSDKPIAVFQGCPGSTLYPPRGSAGGAVDHMYEQALPQELYSTQFVAMGNNALSNDYVELVTPQNDTHISINNNPFTLNTRRTLDTILLQNKVLYIESDKPITGQIFNCGGELQDGYLGDPSQVILTTMSLGGNMSVFTCPHIPDKVDYPNKIGDRQICLNLLVPTRAINDITLDGQIVTGFQPISGCDSLSHATYRFPQSKEGGIHVLENKIAKFTGYLYAMRIGEAVTFNLPPVKLEMVPRYEVTDYDTICQGEMYIWHDRPYYETGFYTDSMKTTIGYDSITHLQLTVWPKYMQRSSEQSDMPSADDRGQLPETWNDPFLPIPSLPRDSILPDVWIDPYMSAIQYDTICSDSVMVWQGKTYNTTGLYTDTLYTIHGCDSVIFLDLFVKDDCDTLEPPPLFYTDTIYANIGDSVIFETPWGNFGMRNCSELYGCMQMTQEGVCEVEGILVVVYLDTIFTDTTICVGADYAWHNITIPNVTQPIMLVDSIYSEDGYNRIAVMRVSLSPCTCDTAYSTTYKQIQETELPTFQWNGIPMTTMPENAQRDTTLVFPTMKMDASCDSIATLHLHILEACEIPSSLYPVYWRDPKSSH